MACGLRLRRKRIGRAGKERTLRKFRHWTKTKNLAMKLLILALLSISLLNATFPLAKPPQRMPPRIRRPSPLCAADHKLLNKGLLTVLRARFAFNPCSELGHRRTLPAAWSPSSPAHALLGTAIRSARC